MHDLEILPYIITTLLITAIAASLLDIDIRIGYTVPLSAPEEDELAAMFRDLVKEYTDTGHELTSDN